MAYFGISFDSVEFWVMGVGTVLVSALGSDIYFLLKD